MYSTGFQQETYSVQLPSEIIQSKAALLHWVWFKDEPCVVKERCYGAEGSSIIRASESHAHEANILRGLDHENIMKLVFEDAKILALFLQPLAPSLAETRNDISMVYEAEAKRNCVSKILYDICSALGHLKENKISHNNIQPAHIAFSLERGAILMGFGKATFDNEALPIEYSHWCMSPEFLQTKAGGAPGDIWALGVAMLWILGKMDNSTYSMKEWYNHDENRDDLRKRHVIVAEIRCELDKKLRLERLVFDMLDPDPEARIDAEKIKDELS